MKRTLTLNSESRQPGKKTLTGIAGMFVLTSLIFAAPFTLIAKDKHDKSKAADSSKSLKGLPIEGLTDDEAILEALNRLGFGPRPGDLDRVKENGLQKWVDRQLHPETINDSAVEAKLERFTTLKMSSSKLLEEFPQPQVAARREGITVEEYRKQQQERVQSAMQSMQQDQPAQQGSDPADALGMPSFDASPMDPNAKPS